MRDTTILAGAAYDSRSLDTLKRVAREDSRSGLKAAAKQLEGMFIQMMLKSMRDATPKEGLFSSEQSEMFTSMLDQQLSQNLAGQGKLGFAEMIMKTLGGETAAPSAGAQVSQAAVPLALRLPVHQPLLSAPLYSLHAPQKTEEQQITPVHPTGPVRDNASFISRLSAPAIAAAQKSGVPHQLIIAQAALESGWGHREIPTREGKPSHNLFGIKATPDWEGETTEVTTTEYVNGVARKVKAAFRVYQSYTEALSDYATLLTRNPRYQKVTEAQTPEMAAHALQSGGYATDPKYAEKLISIIQQVKGSLNQAAKAYQNDLSSLF